MIGLGSLLLLMGSMGCVPVPEPAGPHYAMFINDAIVIHRSAGFTNPAHAKPIDHYSFTVTKNGNWEFEPLRGKVKRGKLSADDLHQWIEDIEDGGLYEVECNPELGALDEPFMAIAVNTWPYETRVRIPLTETLAQAVERMIVELIGPGESPES